MHFRIALIVLSVGTLSATGALVACSSSSTGTTTTTTHDSGTTTSAHDSGHVSDAGTSSTGFTDADFAACTASSTATCGLQTRCNPAAQSTDYGDAGSCITRQFLACKDDFLAPNTAVSAAHTSGCAMAVIAESCADSLNLTPPSACQQAVGTGAIGSACSHPAECASGFCAVAPQSTCGMCQAVPSAGDSCLELTNCGQLLECLKGTCVLPTPTAGGSCGAAQPCGAGLSCVGASDAGTGLCQTAGTTVGASCDPTLQSSGGCDTELGLYCVAKASLATYQTCQQAVFTGSGMPCGRIAGVQNSCSDGTCVKQGDAGSVCVGRAADDASCNTITGPDCMSPARCTGTALDGGTSGTCTLPGPTACP